MSKFCTILCAKGSSIVARAPARRNDWLQTFTYSPPSIEHLVSELETQRILFVGAFARCNSQNTTRDFVPLNRVGIDRAVVSR